MLHLIVNKCYSIMLKKNEHRICSFFTIRDYFIAAGFQVLSAAVKNADFLSLVAE